MDSKKIKKCKMCAIELNESNRARTYLRCKPCHSINEQERHRTYRELHHEFILVKNKEYNEKNKEAIHKRNIELRNKKYGYDDEKIKSIDKEYNEILPKMTSLYNYLDKPLPIREKTTKQKEINIKSYKAFLDWLKVVYNSDATKYREDKDKYKAHKEMKDKLDEEWRKSIEIERYKPTGCDTCSIVLNEKNKHPRINRCKDCTKVIEARNKNSFYKVYRLKSGLFEKPYTPPPKMINDFI